MISADEMVKMSVQFLMPEGTEKISEDAKVLVEHFQQLVDDMRESPEIAAKTGMEQLVHRRATSEDPAGYLIGFMAALGIASFCLKDPDRAQVLLRQFEKTAAKLAKIAAYAATLETPDEEPPKNKSILMPGDDRVH